MISVEQALEILEGAAEPLPAETVNLGSAHGRVLSERVLADRDAPPTDRSAMDGFAVRSADVGGEESECRVVAEVRAGQPAEGVQLQPGEVARIFTGAVVPAGADAVMMVEQSSEDRESGLVRFKGAAKIGQHIRPRAQDRKRGDVVLHPGAAIRAAEIAALATVGELNPEVHLRPRVAVLSTGDEIVPLEALPQPHQIRNSNAAMLLALLRESVVPALDLGNAADSRESLRGKLEEGLREDLLLVTGGVSVGDYDLVRPELEAVGMETLFHGVAMKPGKPILAGRRDGCLVFGLPGNPASALCGFVVFVAPVLRRLMGLKRWRNETRRATLTRPIRQRPGRRCYHLAQVVAEEGALVATPVVSTGSGDVLSLSRANAFLIGEAEESELAAASERTVLLWR